MRRALQFKVSKQSTDRIFVNDFAFMSSFIFYFISFSWSWKTGRILKPKDSNSKLVIKVLTFYSQRAT